MTHLVHPQPHQQGSRVKARSATFRVYFWSQLPAGESHEFRAWQCDEYEIADADVYDVLAWAEERAAGSQWTYVVYVVLEDPDRGRGMVKLAGQDPNDPSEPRASWMVQRPAAGD